MAFCKAVFFVMSSSKSICEGVYFVIQGVRHSAFECAWARECARRLIFDKVLSGVASGWHFVARRSRQYFWRVRANAVGSGTFPVASFLIRLLIISTILQPLLFKKKTLDRVFQKCVFRMLISHEVLNSVTSGWYFRCQIT